MTSIQFSDLIGQRFLRIDAEERGDTVRFLCDDGRVFSMEHIQDCCESVSLEDICGDLSDLLNAEILDAREETGGEALGGDRGDESFTWTFYILRSTKGTVTLRWYGHSNGYYSESVSFSETEPCPEEAAALRAHYLEQTTAPATGERSGLRL